MGPDVTAPQRGEYAARIAYLQRRELDAQAGGLLPDEIRSALRTAVDLNTGLGLWFMQIRGVSRCWPSENTEVGGKEYISQSILAGLNGLSTESEPTPIYYVVHGTPNSVCVYVGTDSRENGPTIKAAFSSQYPGLKVSTNDQTLTPDSRLESGGGPPDALDEQLLHDVRTFIHDCKYVGVLTGMPTPRPGHDAAAGTQLDRLIHGLYGTEWALLVRADPVRDKETVDVQLAFLAERARVGQIEEFRERRESASGNVALYYDQLLQLRLQLLDECLNQGAWRVQAYICSPQKANYERAKGVLKSTLSGEYSLIERLRVLDCAGAGPKAASFSPVFITRVLPTFAEHPPPPVEPFKYHTLLSSLQLSALIHLPRIEAPGYFVQELAHFDVASHVPARHPKSGKEIDCIEIGEIRDRGEPTGNEYRIPLQELTKHCLLVGITGSGKTTTAKHLFKQLLNRDIQVLVIEPAKREYRQLSALVPGDKSFCVFTVGEEHNEAAPFRLNPFEIRPGVSVQTHIDLLRSVFNASFGMWQPLPQVLERAINEIYREKGWDPVQSINYRADGELSSDRNWPMFTQPTLSDLFHKIGELVPKLGYDKEVERNVRTALETRINSLRIGAKGLMLDTRQSVPIEQLLQQPTVLELEGIGDDEEKAFLMGLILTALYEYYRVKGTRSSTAQHVTIIEEAHRLLANVPAATNPEAANFKGKAVETFVSMLSEVRAYGEGFVIAEQIPTKLAPDVIKNTGLKIMHRIVALDDREVMGAAMNLEAKQRKQVVSLAPGEAVVHGGGEFGDDNPLLVSVKVPQEGNTPVTKSVRQRWAEFNQRLQLPGEGVEPRGNIFRCYPTCEAMCPAQQTPVACIEARTQAEDPAVEEAFSALILSLVANDLAGDRIPARTFLADVLTSYHNAIRSYLRPVSEEQLQLSCVLTHATYRYMQQRGAQYGWPYSVVDRMTQTLLCGLLPFAGRLEPTDAALKGILLFCERYRTECKLNYPPFYGCARACGKLPLCLYRYNIEPLLADDALDDAFCEMAPNQPESSASVGAAAAERALLLPNRHLSKTKTSKVLQRAGLCFIIQKSHGCEPSRKKRQSMIDQSLSSFGFAVSEDV